jgi:hypothetical protein
MPKHKRPRVVAPALFDLEPESPKQEAPAPSFRKDADQFVDQFMYLLTAPYMCYPPWDSVWDANDNKTTATLERLMHVREIFDTQQCTEFEAMLYISTATLAHPPSHDWFQIYMWLFNRWNPELAQQNDLIPDRPELNVNQQEDLARLRRWIFNQQMAHLKAKASLRGRTENGIPAPAPEMVEDPVLPREDPVEQPKMF